MTTYPSWTDIWRVTPFNAIFKEVKNDLVKLDAFSIIDSYINCSNFNGLMVNKEAINN